MSESIGPPEAGGDSLANLHGQGMPLADIHGQQNLDDVELFDKEEAAPVTEAAPEETSPKAEAGDQEEAKTPGDETPTSSEPPPDSIEIEGYGPVSVEDIATLLQNYDQADGLVKEFPDLEKTRQDLKDFRELRDMIQGNDEIKSQMEQLAPRWRDIASKKEQAQDPAVRALQERVDKQDVFMERIAEAERVQSIKTVFEVLGEKHPTIVDDDFRSGVLAETVKAFDNDRHLAGPQTLLAVANSTARMLSTAVEKAKEEGRQEILAKLKDQPPGTEVISTGAKDAATPLPGDPTKLSWEQLEAEVAEKIYR